MYQIILLSLLLTSSHVYFFPTAAVQSNEDTVCANADRSAEIHENTIYYLHCR